MLLLVVANGPEMGREHTFAAGCVLGRSPECDIHLSDLNVSRQHVRILPSEGGGWELEDLGSANGTYVNGESVHRCFLTEGDVIQIGGSSFFFREQQTSPYREDGLRYPEDDVATFVSDQFSFRKDPALWNEEGPAVSLLDEKSEEAVTFDDASRMLEAMYAVTDVIASEIDLQQVMRKVLDHLFEVFPQAERGFILLIDPNTHELVPRATKQREVQTGGLTYSQTIVASMLSLGNGVILGNPGAPAAYPVTTGEGAPAQVPRLGAPLRLQGETLGTLHLEGGAATKGFSSTDLALLTAIARQVALTIAHARAGEALVARHSLEADLELAREIQSKFLPRKLPTMPNLTLGTYYSAALQIGGDFYDVIQLKGDRLGVVIGDISGKGVSAALLMAKMTSEIRMLLEAGQQPGKVLSWANRSLLALEQEAIFATVLCLVIDVTSGIFTMANAGHLPPVVSPPLLSLDKAPSVPLGITEKAIYPEVSYKLRPGQVCLLYTDGFTEAMSRSGEAFGAARLHELIASCPPEPRNLIKRIVNEVRRFARGAQQSDDETLMAFSLTPPAKFPPR